MQHFIAGGIAVKNQMTRITHQVDHVFVNFDHHIWRLLRFQDIRNIAADPASTADNHVIFELVDGFDHF